MANPETQIVLGITMFEDVFLAVYLSLISGIVLSGATSFTGVASSGGIALGLIVGLIIIGRWATPFLNRVLRISSSELFVIVVFACLFLLAGLGETIHVAESIGALLLGLILGETEHTSGWSDSWCRSAISLASASPLLAKESERIYGFLRGHPRVFEEEESEGKRGISRRSGSVIVARCSRSIPGRRDYTNATPLIIPS